ncbi:HET-domain-containing protein [Stipitochalara longipes BDJ]|nr:HET-domain-containing protein [Stipitochalara longipes BDJ]
MASEDTQLEYPGLPLNLEDEFRLVEILPGKPDDIVCCHLFTARVRDSPKYEALSYTWGSPDDKQSIQCKGTAGDRVGHLPVTQNCAAALRRLRLEDSPRTVWIDSICIDQTEVSEKNHQLGLMAQIYTQAERVVIHLGESSDDSDSAIGWLHQIDDPDFDSKSPGFYQDSDDEKVIRPETQMLESLFSRPWFNRIWVLQEAILSKTAIVYCGEKTISWDAIKQFKQFNVSAKWIEHLPHIIGRRQITPNDTIAVEYDVLKELLQARHCESTDPRDKIYALLPLLSHAGIKPDIIPNYNHSPSRVYTDVALYLMKRIGLELLCAVNGPSQLPGLASWVPDWSIRVQRPMLGLNMQHRFWSKYHTGQPQPAFTLERTEQNDTLSVHIKTKAFRLGKITGIGDPCADDADIPPFRQWKTLVPTPDLKTDTSQDQPQEHATNSDIGAAQELADRATGSLDSSAGSAARPMPSTSTVTEPCGNDRRDGKPGDVFEYTVRFITDDGEEANKIRIRKWMKGLPPSYRTQVRKILEACRGRRFLVTENGYMGLAPLDAESGDIVFIIPGVSVPFVLREEDGGFRLIGECYVQNVMDGEVMVNLEESWLEDIVIR